MQLRQSITPCLWFDSQAEDAARFYTGIFSNSRVLSVSRFGEAGHEIHGRPPGSIMTVVFELNGQEFTALNGGPHFKFNEAISFQVYCDTQDELDYYWDRLSEGGDVHAQQCGWLKDRFGLSWQIVPSIVPELVKDPESEASQRAMEALLRMKKLNIEALKSAYEGSSQG